MLYCNGNFIGGLFDEELCFVYADSVSELLGQPEPVYRGYSSTAQHRMLVIPEEHWAKALKLLYAEKFDWSRLVYDITYTSIGAAVVEDFYDENVVFLRFCFEKELLKKNPLDRQGRILPAQPVKPRIDSQSMRGFLFISTHLITHFFLYLLWAGGKSWAKISSRRRAVSCCSPWI